MRDPTAPLVAIDPGNEKSAFVELGTDGRTIWRRGILPNEELRATIPSLAASGGLCVIEQVASYGMAVGREVFETCVWIGIFAERWRASSSAEASVHRVERRAVKLHLCHSGKASDANIRAALLDLYGPGKERAVGVKKAPGPLYGIKADLWAALALAVTFHETNALGGTP